MRRQGIRVSPLDLYANIVYAPFGDKRRPLLGDRTRKCFSGKRIDSMHPRCLKRSLDIGNAPSGYEPVIYRSDTVPSAALKILCR